MTPPVFACCLTCLLLSFSAAPSSAQKPSSFLGFEPVDAGQDVKLDCSFTNGPEVIYFWFKQIWGQKPKLISEFFKHGQNGSLKQEFSNDPRFVLETGQGKNNLKILNVQIPDSATYYCVSGYSYAFQYLKGIIVHVKGSGAKIQTSVHQSESETIVGSKNLSCTVHTGIPDGEYSVYWFKDSGEALSRVIYTYGGKNDQCERNPDTQTSTCVYNLPMKNLDASHAGTYYCAVASCGHILFGNGSKLDFESHKHPNEGDSSLLLHVLSGALVFSNIVVVVLAYVLYKTKKNKSKSLPERSPVASAPDAEDCQDEDNLHYAALKDVKFNRSRRVRDEAGSECMYSSVRQ